MGCVGDFGSWVLICLDFFDDDDDDENELGPI